MRTIFIAAIFVLLVAATSASASAGGKPIAFTEGPYTWDDLYPAGSLCEFPVRVTGEITIDQTWFVSGFPPEPDEDWSTFSRFTGNETWTNLESGTAATDSFRWSIRHQFRGFDLLLTVQTGRSTNVKGGKLVEAGRIVWEGEDLFFPTEWHGRFVQFTGPGAWVGARCATVG